MILGGDIGGTKTNLGLFSEADGRLVLEQFRSYPSARYSSLGDVVGDFMTDFPAQVLAAAFGVAGPVINGRTEATNLSWIVDSGEMAEQLGLEWVGLINDLEATAYGTLRLGKEDRVVLHEGIPRKGGTIGVIAAGTGLGEGGLLWDGTRYRAIPSEGGHSDFAPRNDLEIDLLRFLLGEHRRVSYERVVSGPGLLNLYRFFRARASYDEPAWLVEATKGNDASAAISRAAIEGKDEVSREALETFISVYGAEAGNVALKFLATGGLYVGGGIAPKIIEWIRSGNFMSSFREKGRYTPLMKEIPVYVVTNDKAALLGAAHFAVSSTA